MSLSKKTIVDLTKILSFVIARKQKVIVSFGIQDFASYTLSIAEEKKIVPINSTMDKAVDKLLCRYEPDLRKLYNNLQRKMLSKVQLIKPYEDLWQPETLKKYIRLLDIFVKYLEKYNGHQLDELNTHNNVTHVVKQIITMMTPQQ